ncbi:hypothetical protein BURKHO8Y_20108 [Burkholderia sp. 8Y]|nr:hypothetical protein BURKHO8Y_20108 [Burkholderia sp. 8Y]
MLPSSPREPMSDYSHEATQRVETQAACLSEGDRRIRSVIKRWYANARRAHEWHKRRSGTGRASGVRSDSRWTIASIVDALRHTRCRTCGVPIRKRTTP